MKQHKEELQKTKDQLESCLKQSHQFTFDKQTPFAVKFKFRGFNIDLLPTFTTDQSRGKLDFNLPLTQPDYDSIVCQPCRDISILASLPAACCSS